MINRGVKIHQSFKHTCNRYNNQNEKPTMSLKTLIISNAIIAYKNRDTFSKDTLNLIKAKITEAEKKNNNTPLTDKEVVEVLQSMIKQRRQSIDAYTQVTVIDDKIEAAIRKEYNEIKLLETYLPKQFSKQEIEDELDLILPGFDQTLPNNKVLGLVMQHFKLHYAGQYDARMLSTLTNEKLSKKNENSSMS